MQLSNFNIFNWAKKIGRPFILDGAIGSLLQQRNQVSMDSLWSSSANIDNRNAVLQIHKEYIDAGADIITTNTFRTNPLAIKLSKNNSDMNELIKQGVEIAKEASSGLPILIAGSNAPAEDCYQIERKISERELIENHQQHISLLHKLGCSFILNETQSHFDEIKFICEFCYNNKIDFILSLFFTDELKILSGEDLFTIIEFVQKYNPLAIGFNCITPQIFLKVIDKIPDNITWGLYLNCGRSNYNDKQITCTVDEHQYLSIIKNVLPHKPSFVGSCCGSNPNHTKLIKKYFDEILGN